MKNHIFILALLFLFGCKKNNDVGQSNYTLQLSRLKNEYLNTRLALLDLYKDEFQKLDASINSFYFTKNISFFAAAKTNWENTLKQYILLSPFTFKNNSLDHDLSLTRDETGLRLLNPSYVDYVQANPSSGIINNPGSYPFISKIEIRNWNKIGNNENISIGFHTMEFLLFGEDLSLNSGGSRPHSDFLSSAPNGDRRSQYLEQLSEAMYDNVLAIMSNKSLSEKLSKLDSKSTVDFLFSPIIAQIDYLATELIKKPLDSEDEKYEIGRFSDNSKIQLLQYMDAIEIYLNPKNVLSTPETRYFLTQFIQEIDAEKGVQINADLAKARELIVGLLIPFDQAIKNPSTKGTLGSAYDLLLNVQKNLQAIKDLVGKN